jgi:uncharacterized protein RhaS with RHS repeats
MGTPGIIEDADEISPLRSPFLRPASAPPPGMRDASGQMYMRNRYYDPQSGQFTQPDPTQA